MSRNAITDDEIIRSAFPVSYKQPGERIMTITDDEIIKLAREAGVVSGYESKLFQRFAALVAAHERNRIWTQAHWTEYERSIVAVERNACIAAVLDNSDGEGICCTDDVLEAIRARGKK